MKKASSKNIEELRAPKHKTDDNVLPLVITHNPNNPQVIGKIRENFKFLNNSEKMKGVLDKTKLIVSKRQPKNLKRYFTKAQFNSEDREHSVTKCEEKRCGTCDVLITGKSITLKSGKTWKVNSTMNCKARYVIYVIINILAQNATASTSARQKTYEKE